MTLKLRQIHSACLLFLVCIVTALTARADDYQLGQGWHAGDYYFSGYTNVTLNDGFGTSTNLNLDDLSLLINGHVNRWLNPFVETEFASQTLIQQGGNAPHGYLIMERLYNDFSVTEQDAIRFGKTLTQFGDWNTVHAAPLVPTDNRPLTTLGFHGYVAGLTWLHNPDDGTAHDWQLYWQPGEEWITQPVVIKTREFRNVSGGHINKPLGLIDKVGASFQHGELETTGETYDFYGVNANLSFGKLKLMGEAVTSVWSGGFITPAHDHEGGLFGLADYSITKNLHGIVEWEEYQDHTVAQPSINSLLAINYKPRSFMSWKLQYLHQTGTPSPLSPILTGWTTTFSTMF
jgi:hypothetical protein